MKIYNVSNGGNTIHEFTNFRKAARFFAKQNVWSCIWQKGEVGTATSNLSIISNWPRLNDEFKNRLEKELKGRKIHL